MDVMCRIGSLEIMVMFLGLDGVVICRIGSLENWFSCGGVIPTCYLPNRQLRNPKLDSTSELMCYLPNRQLRKQREFTSGDIVSYLPNRQLRKHVPNDVHR